MAANASSSIDADAPFCFSFFSDVDKEAVEHLAADFTPDSTDDMADLPRFKLTLHHPDSTQRLAEELRQYKSPCDRLLPGLRTQSHLYKLVHTCHLSHTVTLSEFGEVIGGATFRLIQARDSNTPCLLLEVLLLAVEQRVGVCGRGYGTRVVNYLKRLALTLAQRRGAAAGIIAQSDCQGTPSAAKQFWVRQRLRATPQAMLLTRALHEWDVANEVYAHAVPMLCWLTSVTPSARCEVHVSERAQRSAVARDKESYRHTRHTRRVTVRLRGALTLLPPIEPEHTEVPRNGLTSPATGHTPAGGAGGAVGAVQGLPAYLFVPPPPTLTCVVCQRTDTLEPCPSPKSPKPPCPSPKSASQRSLRQTVGGSTAGRARVLECRCCSKPIHALCDQPARASVPAAAATAALEAQCEAAEVALSLHLGLPAAADPTGDGEFTCASCVRLIASGCDGHGGGGGVGRASRGGRGGETSREMMVEIAEERVLSGSVVASMCAAASASLVRRKRAAEEAALCSRFTSVRLKLRGGRGAGGARRSPDGRKPSGGGARRQLS